MANGRDGIFNPKFTKNHFLLVPEIMKQESTFPKNYKKEIDTLEKAPKDDLFNALNNEGVRQGIEEGFLKSLSSRRGAIEQRFGKGASEWLLSNSSQLSPEEKMKLFYLFDSLPAEGLNKINPNLYPQDPNSMPVRNPTGGGGVRG